MEAGLWWVVSAGKCRGPLYSRTSRFSTHFCSFQNLCHFVCPVLHVFRLCDGIVPTWLQLGLIVLMLLLIIAVPCTVLLRWDSSSLWWYRPCHGIWIDVLCTAVPFWGSPSLKRKISYLSRCPSCASLAHRITGDEVMRNIVCFFSSVAFMGISVLAYLSYVFPLFRWCTTICRRRTHSNSLCHRWTVKRHFLRDLQSV